MTRAPIWLIYCSSLLALALCVSAARADDVVVVAGASGGQIRLTGRIVEYTGQVLLLERAGRQERFTTDRLQRVQPELAPRHREADQLRAAGRYPEALIAYKDALRDESRIWMQRWLLADLAVCFRNTGQTAAAGDAFLQVVISDPATPFFAAIPLGWQTSQPDGELMTKARGWIRDASPVGRLIGASWLLSTSERPAALTTLGELTSHSDPRIAMLAESQLWRTRMVQATSSDVSLWNEQMGRMPTELQAGPSFVVGQALARLNQHEPAALALMRVVILHPDEADLSAASLTLAARQLENLQQRDDAARLYQEVIERHKESRHAQEAETRLRSLQAAR